MSSDRRQADCYISRNYSVGEPDRDPYHIIKKISKGIGVMEHTIKMPLNSSYSRADNSQRKEVRVVLLERDTPSGLDLQLKQILAKYFEAYGKYGVHKQYP